MSEVVAISLEHTNTYLGSLHGWMWFHTSVLDPQRSKSCTNTWRTTPGSLTLVSRVSIAVELKAIDTAASADFNFSHYRNSVQFCRVLTYGVITEIR